MIGRHHKGFTLVELSLVMAFLSVLLLAILYTTLQIGKLYAKGITNRTINQVGRELSDTLRRDFAAANLNRLVMPHVDGEGSALSGRVCLGSVSYVWNTAEVVNQPTATAITRNGTPISLERVIDGSSKLCAVQDSGAYITDLPTDLTSTSLLSTDARSLAVYAITVTPMATNAENGLYEIKMTIGTNDASATQKDATQAVQCKPPTDSSSDFNYCSVADFDIIVRVGGSK